MPSILKSYTRHKTFISYHHDDEAEVANFINYFDHDKDVLISRGIGASMDGDIIGSTNDTYIKQRIRDLYLRESTVTVILIGASTWGRKFVDWEIAASLRNTTTSNRNGLVAITLPSVADSYYKKLPARLNDNLNGNLGYAKCLQYPDSASALATIIDDAFNRRVTHAAVVDNTRPLRQVNEY
ncbi:hypothetical protein AUR04nite_06180 [Glutamicibacter uratoxydans]|uniref:Thoeris protein ThsB TIR-like domain-containing protein n=1 Tax=Glutamicibacter uratoxydans TaxID=43667 RepID=A0A4Y4DJD4_GLUUR|nr:TIR domain-containing protein [Glutamicibacter uratoxydans]GED05086.1 hypothetical protein AUR04nite_06180 [Glutamicibacter uratoxydans]